MTETDRIISNLKAQIEDYRRALADDEVIMSSKDQTIQDLGQDIIEFRSEISEKDSEIFEQSKKIHELQNVIERLESDLRYAQDAANLGSDNRSL